MSRRFQSSLGDEYQRRYKEGSNTLRLTLARVVKVHYKYNTVDVVTISHSEDYTSNPADDGRFSAKMPIEFGGMDGKRPYGGNTLVREGNLVLIGFVDGSKDKPIVINIYGDKDNQSMLSRTTYTGGDPNDASLERELMQLFTLYPSMTYENIDGHGNKEVTFSGKSFMYITDTDQENAYVTDSGFEYEDLPSSRYSNLQTIEPKSPKSPTMLYVHQGVYDDHRLTFFIKSDGTLRVASKHVDGEGISYQQWNPDGSFDLLRKRGVDHPEDLGGHVAGFSVTEDDEVIIQSRRYKMEIRNDGIFVNGQPFGVGGGGGGGVSEFDPKYLEEGILENTIQMGVVDGKIVLLNRQVQDKNEELDEALSVQEARITVAFDEIEQKVSRAEFDKRAEGVNQLLYNTDYHDVVLPLTPATELEVIGEDAEGKTLLPPSLKVTRDPAESSIGFYLSQQNKVPLQYGKEFTLSFKGDFGQATKINGIYLIDSLHQKGYVNKIEDIEIVADRDHYYEVTFSDKDIDRVDVFLLFSFEFGADVEVDSFTIREIQLEYGEERTEWANSWKDFGLTEYFETSVKQLADSITTTAKSVERVEGDLGTAKDRIHEAEQKITPKAITNTVRTSDGYLNDFGDMEGEIGKVDVRLSEAETKITAEAITATVRSSTEFKDDINQAYLDANQYTDGKLTDVNAGISEVENTLQGLENAFGDFEVGIIGSSEAKAIAVHLEMLASDKDGFQFRYDSIYVSIHIPPASKVALFQAKQDYDIVHGNLINTIENAIKDEYITEAERTSIKNGFASYRTKFRILGRELENAFEATQAKVIADVEERQREYTYETFQPIEKRIDIAESLITDDAIRNTVIQSTEYKTDRQSLDKALRDYSDTGISEFDKRFFQPVASRLDSAENLITAKAITNTVRSSIEYVEDLNKKATTGSVTDLNKKVDGIEIGGRNLAHGTSTGWRTVRHSIYYATLEEFDISDRNLKIGDSLVYRVYVKTNEVAGTRLRLRCHNAEGRNHVNLYGERLDKNSEGWLEFKGDIPPSTHNIYFALDAEYNDGNNGDYDFHSLKLEKGNKATDWTPAPEDVDASINQVQKEADKAIKGVSDSLRGLEDSLGDIEVGIVSASDAKAIASHLQRLDTDKDTLDARYDAIYNDKDIPLKNKGDLFTIKSRYDIAHENLVTTIVNAIKDDVITKAEHDAINTRFSEYRTRLKPISKELEVAQKAIQTKSIADAEERQKNFTIDQVQPIESRVQEAESKITSTAITNTVMESTKFRTDRSSLDKALKDYADLGLTDYNKDIVQPVAERLKTAESLITADAITDTVRTSTKYVEDLNKKATTGSVTDLNKKVDGIEIGGRNLELDSNFASGSTNGWGQTSYNDISVKDGILEMVTTDVSGANRIEKSFTGLDIGDTYTLSIYASLSMQLRWSGLVGSNFIGETGEFEKGIFKVYSITFKATAITATIRGYMDNLPIGAKTRIDWYKLEKGNKATDWTPAPGDVDASINHVQEEANKAIKGVSDSLQGLEDSLGDIEIGIVSASDAKAIASHLQRLGTDKDALDERYEVAYGNSDIPPANKSRLQTAKSQYDTTHASLIKTISEAIRDNKITQGEHTAINSGFATYRTRFKALSGELERSQSATQSRAITTGVDTGIDNLVISSRNQALYTSDQYKDVTFSGSYTVVAKIEGRFEAGDPIIARAKLQSGINPTLIGINCIDSRGSSISVNIGNIIPENRDGYSELKGVTPPGTVAVQIKVRHSRSTAPEANVSYKELMVERATKASAWRPAPEDEHIGGVNLLAQENILMYENANGIITNEGYRYQLDATGRGGLGIQITTGDLVEGTRYVLSFKVNKVNGSVSYLSGHATSMEEVEVYRNGEFISNSWHRDKLPGHLNVGEEHDYVIKFKFKRAGVSDPHLRIQPNRGDYTMSYKMDVWDIQIEEGTVKTAWSPPASDIYKYVDDLELGGRNLLRDSDIKYLNSNYNMARYPLTEAIEEGEKVTIRIYGTLSSNRTHFRVYNSGDSVSIAGKFTEIKKGVYELKTTWGVGGSPNNTLWVYAMPDSGSGNSTINKIKLERGHTASDWTPASEDIEDEVEKVVERVRVAEVKITDDSIISTVTDSKEYSGDMKRIDEEFTKVNQTATDYTIAVGKVRKDLDGIEIGGRNLELDSNFENGTTNGWGQTSYNDISVKDGILEMVTTDVSGANRIEKSFTGLDIGDTYTLSIYASLSMQLRWSGLVGASMIGETGEFEKGKFKVYSITFIATADAVTMRGYMASLPIGAKTRIDWYKLEKGNKATDWSPSPDDMVGKTEVVSSINLSQEGILIEANKIKFKGHIFGQDATFDGEVRGVTGTFGQVTVKDGDFLLEKDGLSYSVAPGVNLLDDHSFELMRWGDNYNATFDAKTWSAELGSDFGSWSIHGKPRIPFFQHPINNREPLAVFGDKAVIVRNANFVSQYVSNFGANTKYTMSAHFKRQWGAPAGGTPRFEVDIFDTDAWTRKTRIINHIFPAVANDYSVVRLAVTFTSPKVIGAFDQLQIKISGGNANWVQVDGAQLIEGDTPTTYLPEDALWKNLDSGRFRRLTGDHLRLAPMNGVKPLQLDTTRGGDNHGFIEFFWNAREGRGAYIGKPSGNSKDFMVSATTDYVRLDARTTYFSVGVDGVGDRVVSPAFYSRTYNASPNLYVTSTGTIGRTSSARKYKLLEETSKEDPYKLLDVIHKTWYDKPSAEAISEYMEKQFKGEIASDEEIPDTGILTRVPGFIAEDLVDAGLEAYVNFGEDGEPEGIHYDRVYGLYGKIIKDILNTEREQADFIKDILARLEKLEG